MKLILASTSKYRRAQLERLGLPFQAIAPGVDEDEFKSLGFTPRELAERLAIVKTEAVARGEPDAVVIGGDQVPAIDGDFLDKPETRDRAIAQLERLAGRSHELITAIAVAQGGQVRHRHADITRLTMRALNREEIERYVDADQPWDCAGSYRIEARGIALFERIESQDHTAIQGLPMIALCSILRDCGLTSP